MERFHNWVNTALIGAVVILVLVGGNNQPVQSGQNLGAGGVPDQLSTPCLTVNGAQVCSERQTMKQATTTVCAIKSPVSTSTLLTFGFEFRVATATAYKLQSATSTTAFATTSAMFEFLGAASSPISGSYTPTTTEKAVMAPNTWINASMYGGIGTFSPTGTCVARFLVL